MIKGFIDEGEESHSPKAQGRWCIVISHLHKSKENSKNFWNIVKMACPYYKEARKELRK